MDCYEIGDAEVVITEAEILVDMLRSFLAYVFKDPSSTKDGKKKRLESIEQQMHKLHKMMPTFEYSEWCSLLDDIEIAVNKGQ